MGLRSLPTLLLQTLTLALRPRVLNIGANLTLTDGPNSGEATLAATGGGGSPAFVGCQVYGNADQSIPNNTTTVVAFDQEGWDTSAIHDTVTHNSRLTIPAGKSGYWRFTVVVEWAGNATGVRYAEVNVNGGTGAEQGLYQVPSSGASVTTLTGGSIILPLVATDYVELQVYQNSGGALNVVNAGIGNVWGGTFVEAEFLGA